MDNTVIVRKTSAVGCSEKPAYLVNQEAKRMLESATQKINTPYVPEIRKKVWHD